MDREDAAKDQTEIDALKTEVHQLRVLVKRLMQGRYIGEACEGGLSTAGQIDPVIFRALNE